ncbi:hypothetical protein L2E82_30214 [Cichorium intybus]|uniref:Uncharacterized protein n=1 Tax=Cichorium intybus TaxID=13427 RepID=A0ACB9CZS7_CICIN|nr:hypothetical protein L2E82_30214 [Cichorium intybus]
MPLVQMMPRGRMYRYPPGWNVLDASMGGIGGGGMVSVPYDVGGMPLRDTRISQPIPISALASALANASPTKQRTTFHIIWGPLLLPLTYKGSMCSVTEAVCSRMLDGIVAEE